MSEGVQARVGFINETWGDTPPSVGSIVIVIKKTREAIKPSKQDYLASVLAWT